MYKRPPPGDEGAGIFGLNRQNTLILSSLGWITRAADPPPTGGRSDSLVCCGPRRRLVGNGMLETLLRIQEKVEKAQVSSPGCCPPPAAQEEPALEHEIPRKGGCFASLPGRGAAGHHQGQRLILERAVVGLPPPTFPYSRCLLCWGGGQRIRVIVIASFSGSAGYGGSGRGAAKVRNPPGRPLRCWRRTKRR